MLEFREERGRLVAVKLEATDPVEAVLGILADGRRSDELLLELRGPAELPEEP